MKKQSKTDLFLELANPDSEGFSRAVGVNEFQGKYAVLRLGNGGSWYRRESALGKKYNVVRRRSGNAIDSIQLHGFNKTPIERPINADIRRQIIAKRCVVLGTSTPECDHKDGRLDDPRLSNINQQKLSDFQPLSKAANNAKRQHCKECREIGKRFHSEC